MKSESQEHWRKDNKTLLEYLSWNEGDDDDDEHG